MNKISLSVAAYELKIDRRTLNKFLSELAIVAGPVEYDARIRGISKADFEQVRDYLFKRMQRSTEDRDELRRELDEVKARLRVVEQILLSSQEQPPFYAVAVNTPGTISSAPGRGLPPGYASMHQFCKERRISPSTVKGAIDRGELACHHGEWHVGRSIVQHAFDEDEQAAVLARYGR